MIYELFLEGQLVDIRQDLGMQLSYNIDDVNKYGSRDTSFSKTIVLPGTAKNNKILGFVGELGSNNPYIPSNENIGVNFNVAQTTKAELRANGLLLLKGVFRLTGIVKERDMIEYEGNLFGELGGFIAAIGADKLEDLNFSEYNHTYTRDNIVNSWDGFVTLRRSLFFDPTYSTYGNCIVIIIPPTEPNITNQFPIGSNLFVSNTQNNNGTYTITNYNFISFGFNIHIYQVSQTVIDETAPDGVIVGIDNAVNPKYGLGYYYPLIDYGTYSTLEKNPGRVKRDYDYRTFRPALFVKEYIDKMFLPTGYTYESSFFDSDFFKKLIIPTNVNKITKTVTDILNANRTTTQTLSNYESDIQSFISFPNINLINGMTGNGNPNFTYIGTQGTFEIDISFNLRIIFGVQLGSSVAIEVYAANNRVYYKGIAGTLNQSVTRRISETIKITTPLNTNDTVYISVTSKFAFCEALSASINILATNPVTADLSLNDNILFNKIIPRNILQKDFFVWIMKMFNLYITEDKVKEKHLLIEPYVDYYDLSESKDWTYKVARDNAWNIKPMGMLNGRFFEYKYKDDNDFYNEGYKKKYNIPYGSRLEDTSFQFAKDKQTIEIGFSPSVLIQYQNTDKVVTAIYKKSSGNAVDQEERMDSNIRIMMAKKMTGVTSWFIRNNDDNPATANLGAALTAYGYAGHFDDPVNPTKDINFGAASEIYFDPLTYPSTNLFNDYWSGYIAEIADKDSKLLTCHVYLTDLDIAQLDFSKPVFIDGVLWRINKVMDFDATSGELTKVELLKVINNG
jgi:hypothetical protein